MIESSDYCEKLLRTNTANTFFCPFTLFTYTELFTKPFWNENCTCQSLKGDLIRGLSRIKRARILKEHMRGNYFCFHLTYERRG